MKAPKQPKKSLSEEMAERLKTLSEARLEKQAAEKREKHRQQEDEMMEMIHGPEWRTRYAGEPELPSPAESEVRLKAS